MWRQFLPNLKKNPPPKLCGGSSRPISNPPKKESAPKLCGGSSRRILKRIHSKILWIQFPLSQKESAPTFCGGSSRRISKWIRPKILWRQFPPNLKKNPPKNLKLNLCQYLASMAGSLAIIVLTLSAKPSQGSHGSPSFGEYRWSLACQKSGLILMNAWIRSFINSRGTTTVGC